MRTIVVSIVFLVGLGLGAVPRDAAAHGGEWSNAYTAQGGALRFRGQLQLDAARVRGRVRCGGCPVQGRVEVTCVEDSPNARFCTGTAKRGACSTEGYYYGRHYEGVYSCGPSVEGVLSFGPR